MILKILMKMKHEYGGKWSAHMIDVLWACKSSLKIVTRFSPFPLIYGIEAISRVKLVIPTPRVVLMGIQEGTNSKNNKGRLADLEGLEEEREVARRKSQRY